MADSTLTPPNHHGDHPGFSGITGLIAASTMIVGRGAAGRMAADLVGVTATDHVVDVGCGPGVAARVAARRGARVTGIDPAPVMLRTARLLSLAGPDVSWLEGVAERLPLPDGAATVVWSLATVHHWPDLEGGLTEAHRVLAPGGRFLVSERKTKPGATGLASHGWFDDQSQAFAEMCRATGFTDVEVRTERAVRPTQLMVEARRS